MIKSKKKQISSVDIMKDKIATVEKKIKIQDIKHTRKNFPMRNNKDRARKIYVG